jgi:hypothetical protein
MLNILTVPEQHVNRGREEFVYSVQIDWSWHTLILYNQSLQNFAVAKSLKNYPGNFTFENLRRSECFIFTITMGRSNLLTIATNTNPACQWANIAIESCNLVLPRSPKWRLTVLKILTVPKRQQSIVEERSLSTLFNLIRVGKFLSFMTSLFKFLLWQKFLKNYIGNFTFENSKSHECFIFTVGTGRWCLMTIATMDHSSNEPCDVIMSTPSDKTG